MRQGLNNTLPVKRTRPATVSENAKYCVTKIYEIFHFTAGNSNEIMDQFLIDNMRNVYH